MAINPVATVTKDILVSSKFGGGGSKKPTVIAGDGVLVKNLVRLVPPDQLLRVFGTGGIGGGNGATFITSLTATPIQNLSNFSRSLRRFQVDRAGLGSSYVEVCAMGKGEVRARVRLSATIARFKLKEEAVSRNLGVDDDDVREAFTCFTNSAAAVTLTLPPAKAKHVGLEYFFAVNPDTDPGSLTVACRPRDVIQFRDAQTLQRKIITGTTAVDKSTITGTFSTANANKLSVVVACRAPRLWVAESVAAADDNLTPLWVGA